MVHHQLMESVWYECWVLLAPTPDIEGQWYAHGLEFDLVAQGHTPPEALDALTASIQAALAYDRAHGLNPLRRRASHEYFDWRDGLLAQGRLVASNGLIGAIEGMCVTRLALGDMRVAGSC